MQIIKGVLKYLLIYAILFITIFFINTQVFLITYIPSESMEPTLKTNQFVLNTRIHHQEIQRYDIVVFKQQDRLLVKRVIGLPGETLTIKGNHVSVQGKQTTEDFLKEPMLTEDMKCNIPEDQYFVMGDNRNHSYDSRKFGTIAKKDMVAIAKLY